MLSDAEQARDARQRTSDAADRYRLSIRAAKAMLQSHAVEHVIATITALNSSIPINSYRETDDHRLGSAAELAAIILVRQKTEATGDENSRVPSILIDQDVGFALLYLKTAMLASTTYLSTPGDGDSPSFAAIRRRFVSAAKLVRNQAFDFQEIATFRGLFGDGEIPQVLSRLGLPGAKQVLDVVEAMRDQIQTAFDTALLAVADGSSRHVAPDVIDKLASDMVLDGEGLARASQVTTSEVAQTLDLLRLPSSTAIPDVDGNTQVARLHPLVGVSSGDMCPIPQNLLPALRIRFEDQIKSSGEISAWESYNDHRASWVEQQGVSGIASFLGADVAETNVPLMRGKQRVGEIDGLVVLENVAIVLEAKSAGLRALAYQDDPDVLKDNIRDLFEKAGRQLTRAEEALRESPERLVSADGTPLGLRRGQITEVHRVSLTLEDASFVAPVIWALQDERVLDPSVPVPWAVSVHQLQTICRILEWSAQLIDWLRERKRFAEQRIVSAVDELDLFMAHLSNSLNLDYPDASNVFLPSGTDEIAEWVLYKEGVRTRPSPRPQQQFSDLDARRELRAIHKERSEGWLHRALKVIERERAEKPRVRMSSIPPMAGI